jgi:hypothetical protein
VLKFGGRDNQGRRIIGMVLSKENLEKLRQGKPVFLDGASVGVDDVVVLLHVTDTPNDDLLQLIQETQEHGGQVLPIERVLEDRDAIRAVGGDPDAEPEH